MLEAKYNLQLLWILLLILQGRGGIAVFFQPLVRPIIHVSLFCLINIYIQRLLKTPF